MVYGLGLYGLPELFFLGSLDWRVEEGIEGQSLCFLRSSVQLASFAAQFALVFFTCWMTFPVPVPRVAGCRLWVFLRLRRASQEKRGEVAAHLYAALRPESGLGFPLLIKSSLHSWTATPLVLPEVCGISYLV